MKRLLFVAGILLVQHSISQAQQSSNIQLPPVRQTDIVAPVPKIAASLPIKKSDGVAAVKQVPTIQVAPVRKADIAASKASSVSQKNPAAQKPSQSLSKGLPSSLPAKDAANRLQQQDANKPALNN